MSENASDPTTTTTKDADAAEKCVTRKPRMSTTGTNSGEHKAKPTEPVAEASSSRTADETHQSEPSGLIGACGGCDPVPGIDLQDGMELCSVVPLPWCPHLKDIRPVPSEGVNIQTPCLQCGNIGENWICLICYEVHCSRYVNEHMLMHGLATEHKLVLSFSDLSVWCYGCDAYVHNEVLQEAKMAAYRSKFK